jgi:hypothetical protein
MRNVTLCTTMWDKISPVEAEKREADLRAKFWAPMLQAGATIARHDHTMESAHKVLRRFLKLKGINVQLQEELAKGVPLGETSTGKVINRELQEFQEKARKELEQMKIDMAEAIREKDEDMKKLIAEEAKKREEWLEKSRQDADALAQSRELDQERWRDAFTSQQEKWMDVLAKQNADHQAAMRQISESMNRRRGCIIC